MTQRYYDSTFLWRNVIMTLRSYDWTLLWLYVLVSEKYYVLISKRPDDSIPLWLYVLKLTLLWLYVFLKYIVIMTLRSYKITLLVLDVLVSKKYYVLN